MWRRRSFVPVVSLVGCKTVNRCIFVRDLRTPVNIGKGNTTYPAVLLWRWKSDRQRHLVLSVHPPESRVGATPEALARGDCEHDESSAVGSASRAALEDYLFGRIFLQPYDVALLLAAFEGKVKHISVEKQHASLQLEPALAMSPDDEVTSVGGATVVVGGRVVTTLPSAFTLVGEVTAKVMEESTDGGKKVALPESRSDELADSGVKGAKYNPNDRRTFNATIEGADLMFVMKYLDAVLGDMFGIQHQYHARVTKELLVKREKSVLSLQQRLMTSRKMAHRYRSKEEEEGRISPELIPQYQFERSLERMQDPLVDIPIHGASTSYSTHLPVKKEPSTTAAAATTAATTAAAAAATAAVAKGTSVVKESRKPEETRPPQGESTTKVDEDESRSSSEKNKESWDSSYGGDSESGDSGSGSGSESTGSEGGEGTDSDSESDVIDSDAGSDSESYADDSLDESSKEDDPKDKEDGDSEAPDSSGDSSDDDGGTGDSSSGDEDSSRDGSQSSGDDVNVDEGSLGDDDSDDSDDDSSYDESYE